MLKTSIALATLGTLGTAALTAVAAALILDLEPLPALLLGSTVAATDAAAVFAVLRGSTLRRRLARTLEGESGINDPVAILLVIGCIEAIQNPDYGILDAAAAGGAGARHRRSSSGSASACSSVQWLRRTTLPSAGLYPVASVATAALAYGAADTLHGSGFLVVYLAGLVLGTASTPARRTIVTFHDGLAWVAQLALFLILGLLVFPEDLGDIWLEGTAIAVATAVFARPLATLLVTIGQGFSTGEKLVLGWAGLRGAVPVVFATFAVTEGIEGGLDVLQHHVLRRAALDGAPGHDDRAPGAPAGRAAPTRRRSPPRWSSRCCSTGSAPRSSSSRCARGTRSSATRCARSACRARRC